ncbi:MAG: hypothetical protein M1341_05060 [Candidatus Thermoplasmatota archaeon]|nr:hypothetical protein [Candidatus Thermoplasmatota archaeon]
MEDRFLAKIRKESEYLEKKALSLENEIAELEKTIKFNSGVLEGTVKDLEETGLLIDTLRRLME